MWNLQKQQFCRVMLCIAVLIRSLHVYRAVILTTEYWKPTQQWSFTDPVPEMLNICFLDIWSSHLQTQYLAPSQIPNSSVSQSVRKILSYLGPDANLLKWEYSHWNCWLILRPHGLFLQRVKWGKTQSRISEIYGWRISEVVSCTRNRSDDFYVNMFICLEEYSYKGL